MAAPVWVLSVDLQTKTATFQTGMAEAAKAARASFTDIEAGSGQMAGAVGSQTYSARQGVMLLANEFGEHLPRGLVTFVSSLGPVGAAMEAAFPFLAIAVGATLLFEHLQKLKQSGIELTQEQVKFGTTVQDVFNGFEKKLLQAQIRSDELKNDHIGALQKQLQLLDRESLDDLAQAFEKVAAQADQVFSKMQVSWCQFGTGSSKAKGRLDDFTVHYEALLAKGEKGAATDLLKGSLASAQKIVDAMLVAEAPTMKQDSSEESTKRQGELIRAQNALRAEGVGYGEKELASYRALTEALNSQLKIEQQAANVRKDEGDNAKLASAKEGASETASAARAAADARLRIGELALQADKARANAEAEITRVSIEQRTAMEVGFAGREMTLRLQANGEQIKALDQFANDYNAKLKELQDKSTEIIAYHETQVAEIRSKGSVEANARDLANLEESIRESIEATQQGSAERLAAIDAAIKLEQAKNMTDLAAYRDLLTQKTEVTRQMSEEQAKLQADAGRETAENDLKLGELLIEADKQTQATLNSAHRVSLQTQIEQEIDFANRLYALKLTSFQTQENALDRFAKDYQNKLKALHDQEAQLAQEHENQVASISDKGATEQNQRQQSAIRQFQSTIASGLTQVLMGHKSFASEMNSIGNQVVSGMMQNAIQSVLANDFTKESDAAAAARKAYLAGMHFPFPANVVMGPVLAAGAFAAVMAFNEGTDSVPGVGKGDVVPAMLTPGEGVVPGGVMDQLSQAARSGTLGKGHTYNLRAHFAPTVHALDAEGVDRVLEKHSDKFQRHFENTVRRMNR